MSSLKTSQCMNPNCLYDNPYSSIICQRCCSNLRLAGRYRALRQIGAGGFARTFEAVDEHRFNSPCVIKQFCPLPQSGKTHEKYLRLFEQEAEILQKLGQNEQIPSFFAFLEQEGRFYIVQEFIEGQDLFKEFQQTGAFSEEKIRQLFAQLLPVLEFIHHRQVIHRDIKPSNIIRRPDNSLVLIDFGGSHQLDVNSLKKSPIAATPGYAAPEQIRGVVSPASDLYSLAATCIRLLAGCFPKDGEDDPLFDRDLGQWNWKEWGITLSPTLENILEKMLQPQTGDRPQSAAVVLQILAERPSEDKGDKGDKETRRQGDKETRRQGDKGEREQNNGNWRSQTTLTDTQAGDAGSPIVSSSELIRGEGRSLVSASYLLTSKLQEVLAAGQYEEADRETWNLMLRIARREKEGCLNLRAIEQLSSPDLWEIDRLWQKYSDGRFGFSTQRQLYRSLGGDREFDYEVWRAFGDRVGWYKQGRWLNYHDLTFAASAVPGHLPACFVDVLNRAGVARGVCGWWRLGFVSLVHKLDECHSQLETSFADKKEEEISEQAFKLLVETD